MPEPDTQTNPADLSAPPMTRRPWTVNVATILVLASAILSVLTGVLSGWEGLEGALEFSFATTIALVLFGVGVELGFAWLFYTGVGWVRHAYVIFFMFNLIEGIPQGFQTIVILAYYLLGILNASTITLLYLPTSSRWYEYRKHKRKA